MELRAYAQSLIEATSLAGKQHIEPTITDDAPGSVLRIAAPGRPPELAIVPHAHARVPPAMGMHDPNQRPRILNALANHELQAVELFAWALLAFPDTPASFRRGCLKIIHDEQRHMQLYLDRLEAHGAQFGKWPLSAHFWNKIDAVRTPIEFVCTMGLTFENANLDFCQEHIDAARAAGDLETAQVLETVHHDEISHVGFAWTWFERWKPEGMSSWDAYAQSVAAPLGPHRARGKTFDAQSRRQAGLLEDFVQALADTPPTGPGGARR